MKRGIIYLAGPMTGHEDYNYDTFDAAAERLEKKGWAVQNPAQSYNRNVRLPYRLYMVAAVNLLLQCKAIALIPGWEESKGARMEALLASRFGLPFYNANTGHRMRVDGLDVTMPIIKERGIVPSTRALIKRLVPVAKELASGNRDGITVSDLRIEATNRGILTGEETKAELSALGHVMRRAGLVNVGTTRRSPLEVTHGIRQTVWFEDLGLAAV